MDTILYAALRSRLAYQIQKALFTEQNPIGQFPTPEGERFAARTEAGQETDRSQPRRDSNRKEFPLKQIRPSQRRQLEYISAIALKYAQPTGRSPLQFAENLVEILIRQRNRTENDLNNNLKPEAVGCSATDKTPFPSGFSSGEWNGFALNDLQFSFLPYFQIEADPSGWIYLRLLPSGLSGWLQFLLDSAPPSISNTLTPLPDCLGNPADASVRDSTRVFLIQHIYARCHSYLRLGQQLRLFEGSLIRPPDVPPDSEPESLWHIQQPYPFPWLLPDGGFRGSHPAEWQLVEQICATLDGIAEAKIQTQSGESLKTQEVLKLADRLSQAWQTFYAACRIADGIQYLDPAQAQIRLGLTCITQKLLHGLLRSIGLSTPLFL